MEASSAFPRAVILCAGEGRRLRPLTARLPKPLLPVGGRPALDYTLELCRFHGLTEIAINLHHRPQAIPEHLGDGAAWGLHIRYSYEPVLLGSAGALEPLRDFLDRPFFVLYGDVLTNLDLTAMHTYHRRRGGMGTVALYRVPDPQRCGIVELEADGRLRTFVEKPAQPFGDLANAGIYLLEPEVLEALPQKRPCDFGQDLFPHLLRLGIALYGYRLSPAEYLIDIGTPENLARARAEWPAVWAAGPFRRPDVESPTTRE
ncbi:MAG: nucleotidyltransferase family protein [Chloroflexia bacterium]